MRKCKAIKVGEGRRAAMTSVLAALWSIGILTAVLASGCTKSTSSGGTTPAGGGNTSQSQGLDQAAANSIVTGQHNKQDVTSLFGNATSVTQMPAGAANGCVESWLYSRTYQVGSNMVSDALVVAFDANGVVCDHAFSQSQAPIQ